MTVHRRLRAGRAALPDCEKACEYPVSVYLVYLEKRCVRLAADVWHLARLGGGKLCQQRDLPSERGHMMHSTRKTADTIGKKSSTKFVSDKATRAKVCLREQALLLCSREKPR